MSATPRLPQETYDCMFPGPPSCNNGGSVDCSTSGLFAYGTGSSIAIVETRSMQLVTVIPMPSPSTTSPLRDFLTHEPSNSHLVLAVGDRQGRIALWDLRVLGEGKGDVVIKEPQVNTVISDPYELLRLEKESNVGLYSPALAAFPTYIVRFCFSPQWRYMLFVTFPKELVVFDLQYERSLSCCGIPRGCGKFLDVLMIWFIAVILMGSSALGGVKSVHDVFNGSSIGTSVPSPAILAVNLCQTESTLQSFGKLYSGISDTFLPALDCDTHSSSSSESLLVSRTNLISISDDGEIWNWLLTVEGCRDAQNNLSDLDLLADEAHTTATDSAIDEPVLDAVKDIELTNSILNRPLNTALGNADFSFKISLVGQLHLLSSTLTGLSVPSLSLISTLARGGNSPAVSVPLVALGSQSGTIDIIDVSSNAVAESFSVHNNAIRGLRWLGNSRVVSFSYVQEPYKNIRHLLILFRDAPVEVWAMTKSPIMLISLALPFTVLEWTLPTAPRPYQNGPPRQSSATAVASPTADSKAIGLEGTTDDNSESFAFALVNGALGVFEVHGRRIRDFRPKWPSSSFVSSDGLVTAMAYRLPHVVMGDWSGFAGFSESISQFSLTTTIVWNPCLRTRLVPLWTDQNEPILLCIAGADSSFRMIEVNIVSLLFDVVGFDDHHGLSVVRQKLRKFQILPIRGNPKVLSRIDINCRHLSCNEVVARAELCLILRCSNERKSSSVSLPRAIKERYRPMPLCSPILFPTPHALIISSS
ncbi:hypothetical protein GIB67_009969 [Kingdonia uniflora]|uniref:Uncharacterized protein n=1 Tax=Kingdonia uniflora TaxID=39325 RepID=A0A7J7L910_9MAGN|nr:hypothetical protein GIB67_009969 [Kingdonia uniflora]